jgi:hypothetical protein
MENLVLERACSKGPSGWLVTSLREWAMADCR